LTINKNESFAPNMRRFNSKKEGYRKQGTILLDDDEVISSSDDDDDDLSGMNKIKKLKKNLHLTENDEELYPQVRTLID
jgi:hypothetical protein